MKKLHECAEQALRAVAITHNKSMQEDTFESYLDREGTLVYPVCGVSMKPLIREGRDLCIIKKKDDMRCKAGDVVLYRRSPKVHVLHRVIKVLPDSYVILGDNRVEREYGITDADILGIMVSFVRDGKEHSIEELPYKLYSFCMTYLPGIRIFAKKVYGTCKRLLHKTTPSSKMQERT